MNTLHATNDRPVHTCPPFLTVEEAAAILRIGRTCAYQLARQFEATDGAEGLPVVRFGRQLRVPLARLEGWAGAPLSGAACIAEVQRSDDAVRRPTSGPDRSSDPPGESPSESPRMMTSVESPHVDDVAAVESGSQTLPFGS